MKTDTRHVETDPLGAIRAELVGAVRRRVALRRRRRRTLAGAAVVALLALGAGATALTGFSTGVPAVDELLERVTVIHENAADDPDSRRGLPLGVEPPAFPDVRPGPGSASPPIELPALSGTGQAVGVAYLSRDGGICFASVEPERARGDRPGGITGCTPVQRLSQMVAQQGAVCCGSSAGVSSLIFQGFAHEDVTAIRLVGPNGPVEARLTEPWTPAAPNAEPIRVFAAVLELDVRGLQPRELDQLMAHPRAQAEFADGRIVDIEWR